MPKQPKTDALDAVRQLAELGESVLELVKETGLLKPKRRAKRTPKAKPAKAAKPKAKAKPKPAPQARQLLEDDKY